MKKNEYATVFYKNEYDFMVDGFKFKLLKSKYHHIIYNNRILATIINDDFIINRKLNHFELFFINELLEKIDDELFYNNNSFEKINSFINNKIKNLHH